MPLLDFLIPQPNMPALRVNGKKLALQKLASHAARLSGLPETTIYEALLQRDRFVSPGICEGIAIPHG